MDDAKKLKWLRWAEVVDAYRLIPRFILCFYGLFLWEVCVWFMGLPDASSQQAAFVSTVVGIAGVVVGFYQNTGRKWST